MNFLPLLFTYQFYDSQISMNLLFESSLKTGFVCLKQQVFIPDRYQRLEENSNTRALNHVEISRHELHDWQEEGEKYLFAHPTSSQLHKLVNMYSRLPKNVWEAWTERLRPDRSQNSRAAERREKKVMQLEAIIKRYIRDRYNRENVYFINEWSARTQILS